MYRSLKVLIILIVSGTGLLLVRLAVPHLPRLANWMFPRIVPSETNDFWMILGLPWMFCRVAGYALLVTGAAGLVIWGGYFVFTFVFGAQPPMSMEHSGTEGATLSSERAAWKARRRSRAMLVLGIGLVVVAAVLISLSVVGPDSDPDYEGAGLALVIPDGFRGRMFLTDHQTDSRGVSRKGKRIVIKSLVGIEVFLKSGTAAEIMKSKAFFYRNGRAIPVADSGTEEDTVAVRSLEQFGEYIVGFCIGDGHTCVERRW